jgi:hypothetical protein
LASSTSYKWRMDLTALAAILSVPAAVIASLAPWLVRRSRLAKLDNLAKLLESKSGSREYRDALLALQARIAEDALMAHVTPWRWGKVFSVAYVLLASLYLVIFGASAMPTDGEIGAFLGRFETVAVVAVYTTGIVFLGLGLRAARREIRYRADREQATRAVWEARRRPGRKAANLTTVLKVREEIVEDQRAQARLDREVKKSEAKSR